MHPTNAMASDEQWGGLDAWRAVRWLITAAASLMLVTLFLTQTASTEAAAPVPNTDVVYHEMAAPLCQQGYNCLINNCVSGNYYFCTYNLGYGYPYNLNYAAGCGFVNCGVNYIAPAYIAPAVSIVPYFNAIYRGIYNGVYSFPNWVAANNGCAVGNFTCYRANYPFVGNPFWWGGRFAAPVVAASAAPTDATVSFVVKEVSPPAAAPVAAPAQVMAPVATPVAAPAAPTANYATALTAPTQAPAPVVVTASSTDLKIYSAPSATAPTATKDLDDHR